MLVPSCSVDYSSFLERPPHYMMQVPVVIRSSHLHTERVTSWLDCYKASESALRCSMADSNLLPISCPLKQCLIVWIKHAFARLTTSTQFKVRNIWLSASSVTSILRMDLSPLYASRLLRHSRSVTHWNISALFSWSSQFIYSGLLGTVTCLFTVVSACYALLYSEVGSDLTKLRSHEVGHLIRHSARECTDQLTQSLTSAP